MRIGLVGCGYVADMYLALLANHPILELGGITDRDGDRASRVAATHKARVYDSTRALLDDPDLQIVVNLTNPREHAAVSRLALEAGKHVYSEKPLATDWSEAVALVELAESRGLQVVSAPCTVLGEAAQTAWKAVRDGQVGKPLLAYAELDDGMVHRENLKTWLSASGNPWPAQDEFEVGCTLEHAGYYVTWLVAMFGPVESVTSFASSQIADKGLEVPLDPPDTPDFTVGCLRFVSGMVARLTCSIIGPHDHTLRIFGEDGTLAVKECWDFGSTVTLARRTRWTFRAEKRPTLAKLAGLGPKRFPLVRRPSFKSDLPGGTRIDFARGVAELAESIVEGRPCRISTRYSLHINEIVLTLQDPRGMGSPRVMTSAAFDPMPPMPWAVP
jgi:predicted dehydrogenase